MNPKVFTELSGDFLSRGKAIRFRVSGSSMAPAIRDGDLLTVEPLSERLFSKGDIALYRVGGGFRAHRVRSFDTVRNELICQGDSWFCRPEVVPLGEVLGVVSGVGAEGRPAPPRPRIAIFALALKGRIRRAMSHLYFAMDSRVGAMLPSAKASEEGRQGSTGKGSKK